MNQKRRILFFTRLFYPHVGGVEKQVKELSSRLIKLGFNITVVTEKYSSNLKTKESFEGINIIRFKPLGLRFLGLISIWLWLLKNYKIIKYSDIVHCHSVYIWYWPFRILFPNKPSYVTFHGWEGKYPIPFKNIIIRKIDTLLADKNITISDYVEKYYRIKADKLMYTSVDIDKNIHDRRIKKNIKNLVYVGRLDEDTGLRNILKALSYLKHRNLDIEFCGDGLLRSECEKYGTVYGFTNPNRYYEKAFICLSPGHTSILEAFTYKCLVVTTFNNPVKKDYLLMTPFKNWIVVEESPKKLANQILIFINNPNKARKKIEAAYDWVKTQSWENAVRIYLDLWGLDEKGNSKKK